MYTFKLDIDKFKADIQEPLKKQAPFAVSHAINKTMAASRKDQQKEMQRYFDGGATRWTLGGVRVLYSNKRNLYSVLYYNHDRPYMEQMIYGGTVTPTKKKLVQPTFGSTKKPNARLNKFGNLPNKYLSKKAKDDKFFVGIPRGRTGQKYYGLWRRYGRGGYTKKGKARGTLKMLVSMEKTSRKQQTVFPADDIAMKFFMDRFYRQLPASFRYAARSGKKRFANLKFT